MNSLTRMTGTVAAAVLGLSLVAATPAMAGGNETTRAGGCSGAGTWKLKLTPENAGRMDIDFEVDTNRGGQRWRVTMFKSGRRVHREVHTTRGISGSFTAHELVGNRRGQVRVRAVRLGGGSTCTARARF